MPTSATSLEAELGQHGAGGLELAVAAVDEDEIGPGGERLFARRVVGIGIGRQLRRLRRQVGASPVRAVAAGLGRGAARPRRLLDEAREAAPQHLAHHGVVVAGGEVERADVEGAVLRLHEAVGAGDDHRADGIGAHDVGIVVDLDAARRLGQAEGGAERAEQLVLRGGVGEPAAERLAGVAGGMLDQVALLAALRHHDLDAPPGARRQGLGQQVLVVHRLRQQDQARRRLVVVELRDERGEHLGRGQRLVGAREIGAVAPVLRIAEEEHLDAELPGLPGRWRTRPPPRPIAG